MFDYKEFRNEVGLYQSDMAKLLNCQQANISRKEAIKQRLTPEHRAILVANFGEEVVAKYELEEQPKRRASRNTATTGTPLIHIDSVGGVHSENAIISPEYIERYIPFPDAVNGDVCIYQSGDSMTPTIPSGAILHLREVENWRDYIGYGNYFVLLLADGRRITKQVCRYDEDPVNYVLCRSINPEHSDEEIPRSFIRRMFKVVNVLTNNGW